KAVVAVPGSSTALVAATAEGAAFGAYTPAKAGARSTEGVAAIALAGPADAAARNTVKRARAVAAAVAYTRDLVNLPPNLLYPETFVDSLATRVKGGKVKLRSYDVKQ